MKKWAAIILLSIAEFVMVLDSTVMNVSISAVMRDLSTDISSMQMAITLYTLTMASLMLIGGKLGSILGRKRAFLLGSTIYGLGSLITAISPNIVILILGWSIVEGMGAALVIPAVAALVATNYKGKDRIVAYAMVGAMSGIAAAAGPLIGGFVTTFFSWRFVFYGEVVITVFIILLHRMIADSDERSGERIDIPSAVLSVSGFTLLVYGMLQSKDWGWITPLDIPVINGVSIAPFDISLVTYLIIAGIILLKLFYDRQRKLEGAHRNPLLKVSMLSIPQLQSGLSVLAAQYIVTASIFFVIPIYLQTTLGYDALSTGLRVIPLSVALILFSILGARLANKWSPKRIVRGGQILLILGAVMLIASISVNLINTFFMISMACIGGGLGMMSSQISNINISAVNEKDSPEVGGLQGVAQNMGSSLGTALIGSFLVASLTTGFLGGIQASALPDTVKDYVQEHTTSVMIVPVSEVSDYAASMGLSADEVTDVSDAYTASQIAAIKKSLVIVAVIGVFTLMISRNLPDTVSVEKSSKRRAKKHDKLADEDSPEEQASC
jgi:MFS family permease